LIAKHVPFSEFILRNHLLSYVVIAAAPFNCQRGRSWTDLFLISSQHLFAEANLQTSIVNLKTTSIDFDNSFFNFFVFYYIYI